MAESIVEAAREGLTREVQWFLTQGEDVNVTDADGRTALHWALSKGHSDCVILLLRAGADLDLQDNDGNAPLHIAIRHNQLPLVKLLVKAGVDLRVLDGRSLNCYHLARSLLGTQSEITKFLAQIMEKVVPGSTEIKPAGQEVQAHTHPDALRTHPVDASSTTPTAAVLVITYAGVSVAVIELSDDLSESLSSLRLKLEEDEVPLRFPYSFVFKTTGAPITRKQVRSDSLMLYVWPPLTYDRTRLWIVAGISIPCGAMRLAVDAQAGARQRKEAMVYQVEIVKQESGVSRNRILAEVAL